MRFVELKNYKKVRRNITMRSGVLYGLPMGLLLFLITVSLGFFEALLFGVIVFVLIFVVFFLFRVVIHKSVDRKREKALFECVYIDVMYRGEMGAISILEDKLKYHTLSPGGLNKDFEIYLSENLFVTAGEVQYNKLQSIKYKGINQGYIIARELPHGLVYKFTFYDIDNALDRVIHRIDEVSKFSGESILEDIKEEDQTDNDTISN